MQNEDESDGRVVVKTARKTEIFVEKHPYQQTLLTIAEAQHTLRQAGAHLASVIEDESQVTAKIVAWRQALDQVQEQLISMDTRLFGGDDDAA
jgi:predicted hotdog family 3-hydroxylacyl-ACP dehydratase